jgi:SAM-dependent MidA family methyltransferase
VGPLFGAVLARALDHWWDELGRPDPFVVVEAGAGAGTLARTVVAAAGACAAALRYVLVERSEPLRARQAERLALDPPAVALGPPPPDEDDDIGGHPPGPAATSGLSIRNPDAEPGSWAGAAQPPTRTPEGPILTSLAELPAQPVRGVVLANELLDNLPFHLLERAGEGWLEVRVGTGAGGLIEVPVPARPDLATEAERLAPDAPAGARIPLQLEARAWLRDALAVLERGRVVVADYAGATPSLARRPWHEWVRTYRHHARGGHPLEGPGTQDITCEVAIDQLARVRPPAADRSQAEFLAAHGIDALVAEARTRWEAGAAAGALEAVQARSRLSEAAALTDPAGLGAFRVLEWTVPGPRPRSGPGN